MRVLLLKTLGATAGSDIGLGYLATSLRRAGHEVQVGDLDIDALCGKPRSVAERVRAFEPHWVGVKVFDHSVGRARSYLAEARAARPGIRTAAGGPHVSGFRARSVESLPEADYVLVGEGERALPMLLEADRRGAGFEDVPGLVRTVDGRAQVNPQDFPADLDALGLPAWDLLQPREHHQAQKDDPWLDRPVPYVPLLTTRGCPFPCSFCAAPVNSGKKLRHHSIGFVVDEVQHLMSEYGIEGFSIADDAFTNDRDYVIEFCQEILRRKLRVRWDASSNGIRVDTVDPEVVQLLEAAGCQKVSFGIETGSARILGEMGKKFTHEQVERAIAIIRRNSRRLRMEGYFIIGYPEERAGDALATLRFLRRVDLDSAWMFGFSPHSGTRVGEVLERQPVDQIRWDLFGNDRVMTPTKYLSGWQVRVYFILAWLTFYARPTRAAKFVDELGSRALWITFRRVLRRVRLVLVPAERPRAPRTTLPLPVAVG